jgi:hypothetical protein
MSYQTVHLPCKVQLLPNCCEHYFSQIICLFPFDFVGFHDPTDKWQGHEVLPLYVRLYVLKKVSMQ